jgi:phosphoglycerate dehydrogenase-like enzyme
MKKRRLLCLYPFTAQMQSQLRAISPELEITFAGSDTQAGVDAVEDPTLDALLANFAPSDLRRQLPRLSWLGIIGAGVEHLRAGNPWKHGVTVTNGSGLHGTAIAEFTLAQMLFFAQRVADRQRAQVESASPAAWTEGWISLLGTPLRDRTLTVVGYGSIGREIARLANAFGMRVLAVKANPTLKGDRGYSPPGLGDSEGRIPARIAPISELSELFCQSDYAVLTLPATPSTERIVSARAIRSLPRHAVLINVARGKILDEEALCAALRDGALRGAVLDVATAEPIPSNSLLWQVPNLVLTPHVSAIQDPEGWWDLVAGLMKENLARFAAGRELLNIVDGAAGY